MNSSQHPERPPQNSKRKVYEITHEIEQNVRNYEGRCLFVTDYKGEFCHEIVTNNCHIISQGNVLSKMKDKGGRVIELQWGVSEWRRFLFNVIKDPSNLSDPVKLIPPKVGLHSTCTGRFACKKPHDHDGKFQQADIADPDFSDPTTRILISYRLALFIADQVRLAMGLYSQWNQRILRISNHSDRSLWLAHKEHLKKTLQETESRVVSLGVNWRALENDKRFNPNLISAKVLQFQSKLQFTGCVYYGKHTAITLFPTEGDWHKMGLLYFTDSSELAKTDHKCLVNAAKRSENSSDYSIIVLKELLANGWGVLAVSPKSYDGLSDKDRLTIQTIMAKKSQVMDFVRSVNKEISKRKRNPGRKHR